MKREVQVEELLRWRLMQAEAEAPPAPRAARLLELARPWWETWPERFQRVVERLGRVQVDFGHAMAEPHSVRGGHPVPAVIMRTEEEIETSARLLYLDARNGRLRLRFELNAAIEPTEQTFEVTFVSDAPTGAPFSAHAALSMNREYRLETELPEEIARQWEKLKVTDRFPCRLILRPQKAAG